MAGKISKENMEWMKRSTFSFPTRQSNLKGFAIGDKISVNMTGKVTSLNQSENESSISVQRNTINISLLNKMKARKKALAKKIIE